MAEQVVVTIDLPSLSDFDRIEIQKEDGNFVLYGHYSIKCIDDCPIKSGGIRIVLDPVLAQQLAQLLDGTLIDAIEQQEPLFYWNHTQP